jgi:hypothetical protein
MRPVRFWMGWVMQGAVTVMVPVTCGLWNWREPVRKTPPALTGVMAEPLWICQFPLRLTGTGVGVDAPLPQPASGMMQRRSNTR